jgi:EAL domain-containing protein (putative c-di-GMP-specific phosphodiesterase class I)
MRPARHNFLHIVRRPQPAVNGGYASTSRMPEVAIPAPSIRQISPRPSSPAAARATAANPSLCFVVDEDAAVRQLLSAELHKLGVESQAFAHSSDLLEGLGQRAPALIFVNVPAGGTDALGAIFSLKECGFAGHVQLLGGCDPSFILGIKAIGERFSLAMLPVLSKPLDMEAVARLVRDLKLEGTALAPAEFNLEEALTNRWVDFWYQPKISLQKRQIAGAELFARIQHPMHGVVPATRFLRGADEKTMTELTRQALISALEGSTKLITFGLHIPLAVNVGVNALMKLPISELLEQHAPRSPKWAGLIFDMSQQQIVNDIPLVKGLTEKVRQNGIKLAIDDFGRGHSSFAQLKHLPFAEIKLDRSFVKGCASDKGNAAICKTIIDMAHNFESEAVAIGVENVADSAALTRMGCDLGQGYLFSEPISEHHFVALLMRRAKPSGQEPGSGGSPA